MAANGTYQVTVTRRAADIRAAQELRHDIFAGEFGAITPGPVGLDADEFDVDCDHVVVWYRPSSTAAISQAVATYRLLPPAAARGDRVYAGTQFDLAPLADLLPYTVETGRSCVRADHRNGATMALLWSSIAEYMMRGGHRYLVGCTSVPLTDGGELAAGVWQQVSHRHLDARRQCAPRHPWTPGTAPPAVVRFPALLQGYLRLGATVVGPPAHDAQFNCVDFLVLLDLHAMDSRYLRYFMSGITGPDRATASRGGGSGDSRFAQPAAEPGNSSEDERTADQRRRGQPFTE